MILWNFLNDFFVSQVNINMEEFVSPDDDVTTVFPAFVRGLKRSNSLVRDLFYFQTFLNLKIVCTGQYGQSHLDIESDGTLARSYL